MAYQFPLNGGRINASIGGNSTSAGAGYQLVSTGTLHLMGGNNITLSQNGQSISIVGGAGGGGAAISAAGNSISNGTAVFSNSNGISFGMAGSTITASHNGITSQSVQTIGGYASGNTTGQSSSSTMDARSLSVSGLGGISAGFSAGMLQMSAPAVSSLSETGIVSISRNGNTISIGAPAFSAGMSNIGNTAGTSGTVSNQLLFAGGNNITLSQSTGAGGNTITISAPNQSNQNLSLYALGNTTQNSSTLLNASNLSFNGLGGATVGFSNGSIQISGATGGGGGGIALANSETTYNTGTVHLKVTGGAMTIASTTGQSYNFSVPATSSLSATGALGISTNGSTISIGAPASSVLSATGLVNISNNGATISIGVSGPTTHNSTVLGKVHAWVTSAYSLVQNSLYLFPQVVEGYVTGSVIKIPVNITNSSSAFAAHTRGYTANFGVYGRNATNSTVLTRLYSTSYTAAMSANSNASWGASIITGLGNSTSYNSLTASSNGLGLSASIHGSREFMLGWATNLAPGEYWFGIQNSSSSAGAAGNLFNLAFHAISSTTVNALGVSQGSTSNGLGRNIGHGVYSTTTSAMPAGISMTQINQLGINPVMYLINTTN